MKVYDTKFTITHSHMATSEPRRIDGCGSRYGGRII